MPLRPHQIEPAHNFLQLLRKYDSAADFSDMGVGKTYVGGWVAAQLALPTLVVGPVISETAWKIAAADFGFQVDFCGYELLRTGRTKWGSWDSFTPAQEYWVCENCQCKAATPEALPICYAHTRGIHCVTRKSKPARYGNFIFAKEVGLVIFDESHRLNGLDTLNCELGLAAKRQKIKTLVLSATPAHTPIQCRALGYILGLHNDTHDELVQTRLGAMMGKPSFKRWLSMHEVRFDIHTHGLKWFATKDRQDQIMKELQRELIPARAIRVTTESIPNFPTCDIQAELYDLKNPAEMDRAYAEMKAAVEELEAHSATNDKAPDHPLTKILRARQTVELLKVPIMTELGSDYLEKGLSVVFFVNFRATIDELVKRFPKIGVIDGSTARTRAKTVARFQENSLRALAVNAAAGGVSLSLHDLLGGFPRAGLASPCFSAETLKQLLGRLPRDGGKSHSFYKILFAAGTIEQKVWRVVQNKLKNLDALMDSDLLP